MHSVCNTYMKCISVHVIEFLVTLENFECSLLHRITNGLASADLQSVSCSF